MDDGADGLLLAAGADLEKTLNGLANRMTDESKILFVLPNCTIANGVLVAGGAHNAKLKQQDPSYSPLTIERCVNTLQLHGYACKTFGDKFLFLIASR